MNSSFKPEDVTLLLKDITGLIEPTPTKEREKLIQSGTHYSEMLPLEYRPSADYIQYITTKILNFVREITLFYR